MNAESFSTYLAQPAKLYQLPYQEIKNLVAEYPYSANLRRLLLLKSKIEQDPKFEQYLHDLASSTLDRQHLYEFVTSEIPQLLELETEPEERLELQDLTLVREKDKILVVPEQEEEKPSLQATAFESSPATEEEIVSDNESLENEEEEEDLSLAEEELSGVPDSAIVFDFDLTTEDDSAMDVPVEGVAAGSEDENEGIETQSDLEEVHGESAPTEEVTAESEAKGSTLPSPSILAEQEETAYQVPPHLISTLITGSLLSQGQHQPQPKSHFQSWHTRRRAGLPNWKLMRRGITEPQAQPKAKEIAKQSVQDPTNLASETLAKLLTRQGQYRKAIKIYQRLSLLYPEKSRYFAATIEELKQKI